MNLLLPPASRVGSLVEAEKIHPLGLDVPCSLFVDNQESPG